ncbi:hypothetical protein [Tropicimonas sp. S265A]|uniref:hypothetical protein n=1 Tax=Tropicimonas sp. S265A TaxID=3415134 RepID=UPI003C7A3CB3
MRRLCLSLCAIFLLSACLAEPEWAPEADVQRLAYADGGEASVTLITVIQTEKNEGGHTALLIDGSQRVIWDPAGTWWHPQSPERNDLHYGITPWMEAYYRDYHVRDNFHVVEQKVSVSQATADAIIAAYQANGAVAKANCTRSSSAVINDFAQFSSVRTTWFPKTMMKDFAELPGVITTTYFEDTLDLSDAEVIGREDL